MSVRILEKLFGSKERIKLFKLFIFNSDVFFDKDIIAHKTKISSKTIRKELDLFLNIGLILKTVELRDFETKRRGIVKKKIVGFVLNKDFAYLNPLKSLLINTIPVERGEIVKKLSKISNVKLILLSGIFIQVEESHIDLLVVADNVRESEIGQAIKQIEVDVGQEIRYVVFSVPEFKYRQGLNDRLMRDIFDYPHQILLDKIGL